MFESRSIPDLGGRSKLVEIAFCRCPMIVGSSISSDLWTVIDLLGLKSCSPFFNTRKLTVDFPSETAVAFTPNRLLFTP